MAEWFAWTSDPAAWIALATLIAMEVVLGIDNLIFISILTNKLHEAQRSRARRIGIGGALILRLALLGTIAWAVQLRQPLFSILGHPFSGRDLILLGGGLFLVWKATKEIHHHVDPDHGPDMFEPGAGTISFGAAVTQILLLDLVFSLDSIITAVGMVDEIALMVIAILVAVGTMLLAADPLARFIGAHPTIVMLALGFLLMIGMTLIAEGFGAHVPKGYVYGAIAFSAFIEGLNLFARRANKKRKQAAGAQH